MEYTKTTIRLRSAVKEAAEQRALEEKTTLQEVINQALLKYLSRPKKRVRLEDFIMKDLGIKEPINRKTLYTRD